ncbi:50S ribosomal protein L35 [bacterium]|nr:50S ribosomal protein L35 [bacterium]
MPKMKTKAAMKKRIKVTASGRIKHKKQGLRHILTKKDAKRKRHLRKHTYVDGSDEGRLKRMLNQ